MVIPSKASFQPDLENALRALLGKRLTTAPAVLEHHGKSEGHHKTQPPDAVCFANSTEEVSQIVRLCAENDVPIIPYGTGTSLEGHVQAVRGGVSIALTPMNKILVVNVEDLDCRVQAGVTRKQLNTHLRDTGLFFPIDPGADASIGGMSATRASGTNAVRYGTMRENVLGLTVVLPDGRIIKTGGRTKKSAVGYDLTRLYIGSEGTLGVITEVQLRLFGIPQNTSVAVCQYPNLEAALNTVISTIQNCIPVARIELLDEVQMDACIKYSRLKGLSASPTLFFEFHGTERSVVEQAEMVGTISGELRGKAFQWAIKPEERNQLWQARHDAYYAGLALEPGKKALTTDACVPISRLADCMIETRADIEKYKLTVPIVSHAGDGNFHLIILYDPNDEDEIARACAINERLICRTLAMGGTCSGEHGVGLGKMPYLPDEHGESLMIMRTLKHALDPNNIMNPGKMIDS